MSTIQQTIKKFVSGIHNMLPDEEIPVDAASSSLGWGTIIGTIALMAGRQVIGGNGAAGKNYAEHVGYKANGTKVRFRKVNDKIQVLVGSVWTNVITGLTTTADYTCANYSSLAGTFVFFFGVDGIFKVHTANATDYAIMYNSSKNFKGFGLIDKGRTLLWGRAEDPTGLYGSYIDAQNGTVYTTVTGEATTSLSGTLAFKAGAATRSCFAVAITITASGEVYTDNYNGVLTGSLGGTGTINYMTGAYTLSNAGVGTAVYQWEDSNVKGVTDFTKTASRLAGEGFIIRQDAGGDPIMSVLPLNGSYFSMKRRSVYQFTLDSTDLAPENILFRADVGVQSLRSAVATGVGIFFINTANATQPTMQKLTKNPLGDNFDVKEIFSQFNFASYQYTDAMLDSWDKYLILACKNGTDENSVMLLCDPTANTIDIAPYGIRTSCKLDGVLYGGDPLSQTTFEIFTGTDDLGFPVSNFWKGRGEILGGETLKRVKRRRIKGGISPNQTVEVYESYDDGDPVLIGTILGSGSYVDYTQSYAVGTVEIGGAVLGGGTAPRMYPFYVELKVRGHKFRKRNLIFVATGIGNVAVDQFTDYDIWTYENKLPARYRQKQNVSLSGTPVDMAEPNY